MIYIIYILYIIYIYIYIYVYTDVGVIFELTEVVKKIEIAETYLRPCQAPMIERFCENN